MLKLQFSNQWDTYEPLAYPCPWEILQLEIIQQEGHVPKATMLVSNFKSAPCPYVGIFEGENLLFQGVLSGQFEQGQHLSKITALGICPSFDTDLKTLLNTQPLPYEAVFFQDGQAKLSDHLEGQNSLFYWDPKTGKVSLSDYFKGKRLADVGKQYLAKTFKRIQIRMPLGKVVLELSVEWTQTLGGLFNAAPYIARAFPENVMATLTPNGLINTWPSADQRLGAGTKRSGYRVDYAKITRIHENLGLPRFTQPIAQKPKNDTPQSRRLGIHYFKGDLKIDWQYHQPRIEKLNLSARLNHAQHQFTTHRIRRIPITIRLSDSPNATFFDKPQAKAFIDYAKLIVAAQLRASARCIQVFCTLPWALGRDLTLTDSLKLTAPDRRTIAGKITKVRTVAKGLQRYVEVTLASCVGAGDLKEDLSENLRTNDALQGITFENLNPLDLIQGIEVKNSATKQELHLLQNQYPGRDNPTEALAEVPTIINLKLRDLRSQQPLIRQFVMGLGVV